MAITIAAIATESSEATNRDIILRNSTVAYIKKKGRQYMLLIDRYTKLYGKKLQLITCRFILNQARYMVL